MKTALVTGAAGFIGSSMAEKLLKDGFRVIGIDSFKKKFKKLILFRFLKKPIIFFIWRHNQEYEQAGEIILKNIQ